MIAVTAQLGGRLEDSTSTRAASEAVVASAGERFLTLVERELDRSYRLAGLLLANATEAEDAVGDALERAWRELGDLREPARLQAWFDRILVNACRDRLRRRGRVQFVEFEPDSGPRLADPFRALFDGDEAGRLVRDLTIDEREIVVLHFWADLTLESVAARLDLRLGTVKSRLHRALVRMRAAAATAAASEQRR
jgi:RNA polymerase sigma-70 factor (ECF subfamily)